MRHLTVATHALAATTLLGAPASAQHSMAMFDMSGEVLIQGEGLAITQACDPEVSDRYLEYLAD